MRRIDNRDNWYIKTIKWRESKNKELYKERGREINKKGRYKNIKRRACMKMNIKRHKCTRLIKKNNDIERR